MSGEVVFTATVDLDGKPYALGFRLPVADFLAEGRDSKRGWAIAEALRQLILMTPEERAEHSS